MAKPVLCKSCLTVGKPKSATKGSIVIELFLWLFFCVPGLLYSLWRMSSTARVCRTCGGTELIPPNSPAAKKLLGDG